MTTTYTFEQLKADVTKEAQALRVHATREEREKLDIEMLDPNHNRLCIYGLLTGECDCRRASFLINKCTSIFIDSSSRDYDMKTVDQFREYHWSPIEYYIILPEAKNANLIAYLRGETETLDL